MRGRQDLHPLVVRCPTLAMAALVAVCWSCSSAREEMTDADQRSPSAAGAAPLPGTSERFASGDWDAIADRAEIDADRPGRTDAERAGSLLEAAEAHLRSGRPAAASFALARFRRIATTTDPGSASAVRYHRLMAELDADVVPQAGAETEGWSDETTAQESLWMLRQALGAGRDQEALEIADHLSSREGLDGSSRAETHFAAYLAATRMGDAARAAVERAAFDAGIASVPSGATVLLEMAELLDAQGRELPEWSRPFQAGAGPEDAWGEIAPAAASDGLANFSPILEHCRSSGADAVVIVSGGRPVAEWQSRIRRRPAPLYSATGWLDALVAGLLVDEGRIAGKQSRIGEKLPDWQAGRRGRVTLEQALKMTAALPDTRDADRSLDLAPDPWDLVRALEPEVEPGEGSPPSAECLAILGPFLTEAAGRPIDRLLEERVLEPIGARNTRFHGDRKGRIWTHTGAQSTARDLARIGLLLARRGLWEGRSLVSAAWIETMLTEGMGFRCRRSPDRLIIEGDMGTGILVLPAADLVVVRLQSRIPSFARLDLDPWDFAAGLPVSGAQPR